MKEFYKKEPICIVGGVPIFSENDDYVDNYNQISFDHVSAITQQSDNPWIAPDIWNIMEDGTLELTLKYLQITPNSGEAEKKKILDVGVGLGRLLSKIKEKEKVGNLEIHGIDISMHYLKIAKSKGINVAMSKIEDMPYYSNYFDIITCTDVLEHVLDLNLAINKMLDCLKPGGYLVVRVPNREDLSSYLRNDYPYHFAHIRDFNEYSLELLFTRIFGLDFCEKKGNLFLNNPSLLKYRLPVKGYNLIIKIMLRFTRNISPDFYKELLEKLFHPTEINVVLMKTVE